MTTAASYIIIAALSLYAFFDGARDKILFDMAVTKAKSDAQTELLLRLSLKSLVDVKVSDI